MLYIVSKKTCLKGEEELSKKSKIVYGVSLGLSLLLTVILLVPVATYLQASMWLALIPFTICTTLSILYLTKG